MWFHTNYRTPPEVELIVTQDPEGFITCSGLHLRDGHDLVTLGFQGDNATVLDAVEGMARSILDQVTEHRTAA